MQAAVASMLISIRRRYNIKKERKRIESFSTNLSETFKNDQYQYLKKKQTIEHNEFKRLKIKYDAIMARDEFRKMAMRDKIDSMSDNVKEKLVKQQIECIEAIKQSQKQIKEMHDGIEWI